MKKIIFLVVVALAIFFIGDFLFSGRENQFFPLKNLKEENIIYKNIAMGDSVIKAEIALSEEEKRKGLSGRKFLPEDAGMLFIFDKPNLYVFWMKEMKFPIDIIWIGDNLEIIDITENLNPDSYPRTFFPSKPAQFVVEVNAGWVKKHYIKKGMTVRI